MKKIISFFVGLSTLMIACNVSETPIADPPMQLLVHLAAGTKGKRFALPNARILIHQPLGGAQGQATEIEIQAKEILRIRAALDDLLSEKTGQTAEKIHADTDRDYIMSAEEAKEYGMIDAVMTSRDLSSAALVAASSN